MTDSLVKIVDGGVILISPNPFDVVHIRSDSITSFSGPSITDMYEVYTAGGHVHKLRAKTQEAVNDTTKTLQGCLKVNNVATLRAEIEDDLLYIHKRIDRLYDMFEKRSQLEPISEVDEECESVQSVTQEAPNPWLDNDCKHSIFVILLSVLVFQIMYTVYTLK